jgi:hypothetical protein
MSGEEYTPPPTHNAACLTYDWQSNEQYLRKAHKLFHLYASDGSQVPLMGPG